MKTFTMILLMLSLAKTCNSQTKTDMKDVVFTYTAVSRGFHQEIIVKNQMIMVTKSRDKSQETAPKKIAKADWEMISDCFQDIKLDEMNKLKAPSERRFFDGAAIGDLKITVQGKVYQSTSFDHGNPPAEIKELVNKINTFAEKK
jgi:hypothetical protein